MTPTQLQNTALMLNFDMLGSPNYINGISNGANDTSNPVESSYLTNVFQTYYDSIAMPFTLFSLNGRSDFHYFMEAGIPVGALSTGAGSLKSVEDAIIFGGTAGKPYDQCYHTECDNMNNINMYIYDKTSRAAAYAVESLASEPNLRRKMATPLAARFIRHESYSCCVEEVDAEFM